MVCNWNRGVPVRQRPRRVFIRQIADFIGPSTPSRPHRMPPSAYRQRSKLSELQEALNHYLLTATINRKNNCSIKQKFYGTILSVYQVGSSDFYEWCFFLYIYIFLFLTVLKIFVLRVGINVLLSQLYDGL